ncbi:Copper homeostasis protein CutC [Salinivirga cyanobacteriivorans]|uniref:PF03932 family protein CutC n=1 Tax=Salinivirga cyanobacteriivorans TaxID=1307839 RepID=A0A0S2HVP6_9BACT|nr:copper homeostasis protein CutC [Salinivirga cyanobacteriivorans]ALO14112.1 Copper homeostasis protein CutC [Salinivirga cyanobacteriivorans]
MINRKLEICCYTAESAILAEAAGAHRIELCDNYAEGGTTPSFATIQKVVDNLDIPVNVIVRPRGGDFVYSEIEYAVIKEDVRMIKDLGANGVVVGFLSANGEIDLSRTKTIIEMVGNMEVTFHRAFDMCKDPYRALDQLIELDVTRILTSGQMNSALEGADLIGRLIKKAQNNISIMPGSGVNAQNLDALIAQTNATDFHSSAKTFIQGKTNFQDQAVSMNGSTNPEEFRHISVDQEQVRAMLKVLNEKL